MLGIDNFSDYYDVTLKESRLQRLTAYAKFRFVKLDVGDRAGMEALFATEKFDKVIHLANQLLSLARIESGAQSIAEGGAQRLDLSQLARELGLAMAALAHKRGVALALEAEAPVWIDGEPTLISELLSNLLDNALAHTLGGGNVVLRVLDGAVLEVEDDGPGIPVAERDRVFARFYRRDTSGHGAGLGLAIVGEIVRAHRAEISLDQGALGGLLVRVRFIPAEG